MRVLPPRGGRAGTGEVLALVITYRRPAGLRDLVASLRRQSVLPRRVIVVDNGADPGTAERLEGLSEAGCEVVLIVPDENLGPAGATQLAMTWQVQADGSDPTWWTVLNDDLTFNTEGTLEEMLDFAAQALEWDPSVGAVGRIGHRFDRRWARLRRPPEIDQPEPPAEVEVDYLTTGAASARVGQPVPLFRFDAIRRVGPFWGELFIGMTEVEYGLRLREHGYRLLANGGLWFQRRPDPEGLPPPLTDGRAERTPQRRYYSARNLVVLSRVYGRWWTPFWVTVSRGGAAFLRCLRRPGRETGRHLAATARGLLDGWRPRLGRVMSLG